jgi:alkanesulfonate monooxygenase SsuD/methylene tetrahydromethanopterin reductase-like flavin-dependent oxidoreductase (luciferase family)
MSRAAGFTPKAPIILTNVSCAESREEAQERAARYLGRKWQSIDDHYHFSDGHLANVKGYEAYGKTARTYAKLKDPANLKKATDFYVSIQIVGTPDDCLQQLGELQKVTGLEHLVAEFSFGNLPHHEAEKNLRLFADRVLPTLQRDPAYAAPKAATAGAEAPRRAASGGIFAPA